MERLPTELIGNIISRLGPARDVVIASTTRKQWRDAFCRHLPTLSLNSKDRPSSYGISQFETEISTTLLQIERLQGLSISMDEIDEFSAPGVISWLMHSRETLRSLFYNVRTTSNVNILVIYERSKLETLFLAHNSITGVNPNYQGFSWLKSLSLKYVSISALDLSLLLTACPKIEILDLANLEIAMSDTQDKVELRSPTLKSISVEGISLDEFILEADSLERLHLKYCQLKLIKLVGKGTLKQLVIDDVTSNDVTSMDEIGEFSAFDVISWLMHSRETLRSLFYNVRTTSNVNILVIYERSKLETLFLAHNSITGVNPNYQGFSLLKSLSLKYVSISALDLSLLLTACPKIEILDLVNLEIAMSDTQDKVELRSPTLKSICVEQISLDEFILEADSLERLHLKDCDLKLIKLVGKGTLKQLVIDGVTSTHFDIGETLENLEVVDIYDFTIIWPQFYKMISRSSKLRRLRLWDVFFDDKNEIVDLETFAVCFPQLSHLSLWYVYLRDGVHYALAGSSHLENVIEMELGWTTINELFPYWVVGLVKRCPNLRKLVIHGQDMDSEETEECMRLTSLIKHFMDDKYEHVEVQLAYQ